MIARLAAWPHYLRMALFVLIALAATALFSRTEVFTRVDWNWSDAHGLVFARSLPFDDVVVIDIDEESVAQLQPKLGPLPYDRDVYALITQWLLNAGAAAVGFDILFAEPRKGDEAFSQALDGRVVLAAAALPYTFERDAAYRTRLAAKGWGAAPNAGAYAVTDLTLPISALTARAAMGVVSAPVDRDGTLRRAPLVFRAHGQLAPGFALALLHANNPAPRLVFSKGGLSDGKRMWPVSADAEVLLRFPSNMDGLRTVPFYQAALAASGVAGLGQVTAAMKGKRVLIGSSSAALGDYVQTPLGRVSGVKVQALMTQLVLSGGVLAPRHWAWELVMVLGALGIVLGASHPRWRERPVMVWGVFPLVFVFVMFFSTFALAKGQAMGPLFATCSAWLAHLAHVLFQQVILFRNNLRLETEKRAAQQAEALKSQFLSHITHELRTPLTAIMGFNNINWHGDDLGRNQRMTNSEVVDRNCRHMLSLVNNLLDQAKIEAGQLTIQRHPDKPLEAIQDALETVRPLLKGKPVKLRSDAVDVPSVLDIDAFRLRQILLNLLSNAIKFTDKGEISVVASWAGDELTVSVIDTGPGMPPEVLGRLFSAFQQANAGVAATHGGTGLGLTISRNLARLMGGDITVRSMVGQGTAFTASMQAARVEVAGTPDAQNAMRPVATPVQMLDGVVLLAEDKPDIRLLMVRQLEQLGVTVLQAEDGQQAIEAALAKRPNVVLMDMEMPVVGGAEATRTLRMCGFAAPIIALTAHRNEEQHKLALASGCNSVLEKPLARATMVATLSAALATRAAHVVASK